MLAPPPGPTFWDKKLFFYLLLNKTYPFYRIIYMLFKHYSFSTPQISNKYYRIHHYKNIYIFIKNQIINVIYIVYII